MDAMGEGPVPILNRTDRKTRGRRMSKLLDEELETDEQFWGQEIFKEDENDNDFEHVEDVEDVADEFDSDFDDDEEPQQDEDTVEVEERRPPKKKMLLGMTTVKKKSKKKGLSSLDAVPQTAEDSGEESKPSKTKQKDIIDVEGERTIRKSTRTAVIVRQAERDALRAALQSSIKPVKRRKEGEDRRMTQEEMLLEAAQTEIMNLRHLEKMLAREEEVKKKAITNKSVYEGPMIRYHSKDGKNTIEFTKVSTFPSDVFSQPVPYPDRHVCVVTGQPAKYRDPLTGLPYATKEAFKIIRERFAVVNKRLGGDHILEKGPLANSILGEGFCRRQKRSNLVKVRSFAYQQKPVELELQSEELILPSTVHTPLVSDVKHDFQATVAGDTSRLASTISFPQSAHDTYVHANDASDPRAFLKERHMVTTKTGGSAPTSSVALAGRGTDTREASAQEGLDWD